MFKKDEEWFSRMDGPTRAVLGAIHALVTHRFFNYFIYFAVLVNGIILVVETSLYSADPKDKVIMDFMYQNMSYFFIGRKFKIIFC